MPGDTAIPAKPAVVEHVAMMARIRAFEMRVGHRFREGDIHGFVHTSVGQEAVAAGVCSALRAGDVITTTHRGHGHCLAKGAEPRSMMAELFGRVGGTCRGRGGSMHLADPAHGILGANGIVGAGIPIAVGAALAARASGDRVAVAFFGEGAVHCGAFHEGVCLAVAWRVPVIFVCENNRYAEFTVTEGAWHAPALTRRAEAYGLAVRTIDGNDVVAVAAAARAAINVARDGGGPTFLEMQTYRMGGHYEGDGQAYRDAGELDAWREQDPIARAAATPGVVRADVDRALADAEREMDDAVAYALDSPYPKAATALAYIDD